MAAHGCYEDGCYEAGCAEDGRIEDVRHEMPNYAARSTWRRAAEITGIAIHHSAMVHNLFGQSFDDAHAIFDLHVNQRKWDHGGYHYIILTDGTIQYALDEAFAAWHAGFQDPEDRLGLEAGQYWNNHFLAICLTGWFGSWRWAQIWRPMTHRRVPILNLHTRPSSAQMHSLIWLLQCLMAKYALPPEQVRGHCELEGHQTQCPGPNFDLHRLRGQLATPRLTAVGQTDISTSA